MKSKFLMFLTLTLILCGMVFGLYWKYIRSSEYPVFIESFDHGVLTVDSTETTGKDNKYKLFWDKDEIITININPERTSKAYYNLDKLVVNGEDVTDQVSMLQYRTPVTSKMTILAYFKKGKAPSSTTENAVTGTAKAPSISKYYDNAYVGAYAAYDVEDPTIFRDTKSGYYYCFGSDNVVIKSKDLVNWSGRTTYFKTPENANTNAIMDFSQFESVKKWAAEHGYDDYLAVSDTNSNRTPLSPDVVKIGSTYYLYFSLSKQAGANESAIFVVKTNDLAKSISEKKWVDGGMVICSCGRHAGTEKVTDAEGNRTEQAVAAQYDAANAVHPSVYYDGASLYMVYGGYQGSDNINGGIYLLELDTASGLIKQSSSVNTAGETIGTIHGSSAKSAGTLLAKPGKAPALTQGSSIISAADIAYNKNTGYYYLFTTYGVDDTNYNIRVSRSDNIAGPYTDFNGKSMIDDSANQYDLGYMLVGGYNFTSSSKGCVAYTDTGRASVGSPKLMIASNGTWLMASQSQLYYKVDKDIVTGSVIAEKEGVVVNTEPALEIRELAWDDTGWPVAMPETFSGRVASKDIEKDDIYGIWDVLVFDSSADKTDYRAVARSTSQRLSIFKEAVISANDIAKKNKTLNTEGVLKEDGDSYKMTVDGVEYKLHVRFMWDWELKQGSLIMTGLGADGSTIWGKKNFSSTTGMYTDAFYYLYDMCDETTKAEVDAKVQKISANPSQSHIDVLSQAMIKRIIAAQAEK